MNMKKILPVAIIVLAVIVSALYFEVFRYLGDDKSKIEGSGTIEVTEIEISSKVAGRVASLPVDEGSAVKQGDLIVKLNYDELSAQRSSAMANLSNAEKNLERKRQLLKKGVISDDELSAQLASAMANLSSAEKNLERMRQLFKKRVISNTELENAETAYTVAQSNVNRISANIKRDLENAETAYTVAQSNVNRISANIKRDLENAETAYTVSQSNVNLVSSTIENAVIYSPIDGVVLEKNLEKGEIAFPGSAIITLADLKKPWVNIYVDEKKIGLIKLGQKAYVQVDSFPKRIFTGEVVNISNKAEFTPRTIQTKEERVKLMYAVKIAVENPEMELKPGMPADATIPLDAEVAMPAVTEKLVSVSNEQNSTKPIAEESNKEDISDADVAVTAVTEKSVPVGSKQSKAKSVPDEDVRNLINKWLASWQSGDMETYRSCYASDFESKRMDLNSWISYKTKVQQKHKDISISIDNLEISSDTKTSAAMAVFTQYYSSLILRDKVKKTLNLKKVNGEWKIYKETA